MVGREGQDDVATLETLTEVVAENAHSDKLTLARMTAPACLTFVTCALWGEWSESRASLDRFKAVKTMIVTASS